MRDYWIQQLWTIGAWTAIIGMALITIQWCGWLHKFWSRVGDWLLLFASIEGCGSILINHS